jgi:hypothetical protein
LLCSRHNGPRRRAAEQRDEVAPLQVTELHPLCPDQESDYSITYCRGSVRASAAVRNLPPAFVRMGTIATESDMTMLHCEPLRRHLAEPLARLRCRYVPTSASTRSGLPLPFWIFSGGVISTLPVGGSWSRLVRH